MERILSILFPPKLSGGVILDRITTEELIEHNTGLLISSCGKPQQKKYANGIERYFAEEAC